MYDICWLDCSNPGERLVSGGSEIVLCEEHMQELKSKAFGGYSKAPLPADSRATRWPWRRNVKASANHS